MKSKLMTTWVLGLSLAGAVCAAESMDSSKTLPPGVNPLFRDAFTADPSPLAIGNTLYVYCGEDIHDERGQWHMPDWRLYSTEDMIHWTSHGVILKPTDFAWGKAEAWACGPAQNDGKFYLYVTLIGKSPTKE